MYFITRKYYKNKSHYLLHLFPKSSQIKKKLYLDNNGDKNCHKTMLFYFFFFHNIILSFYHLKEKKKHRL